MNAVYLMHTLFVNLKIFAGLLKISPVFCIIHQTMNTVFGSRTNVFSSARLRRLKWESYKIQGGEGLPVVKFANFYKEAVEKEIFDCAARALALAKKM